MVRVWRWGFDWVEGWGVRGADGVVVNSLFTRGVVEGVWGDLGRGGGHSGTGVVYPCVDTEVEGKGDGDGEEEEGKGEGGTGWNGKGKGKKVVLSINRFERKKAIGLAVRAYAGLEEEGREGTLLVIAGKFVLLSGRLGLDPLPLSPYPY